MDDTFGPGQLGDPEVEELVERLDQLLAQVEQIPGVAGEVARDAVSSLAHLYGEALARIMHMTGIAPDLLQTLAGDELVGHLLALHGLHPQTTGSRVEQALGEMKAEIGNLPIRFTGVEGGVARLQMDGSARGSERLTSAVHDILLAAAPELEDVEVTTAGIQPTAFIPVGAVKRKTERTRS